MVFSLIFEVEQTYFFNFSSLKKWTNEKNLKHFCLTKKNWCIRIFDVVEMNLRGESLSDNELKIFIYGGKYEENNKTRVGKTSFSYYFQHETFLDEEMAYNFYIEKWENKKLYKKKTVEISIIDANNIRKTT